MGVMRGSLGKSPFFHRRGHNVGNSCIDLLPRIDRSHQLGEHVLGQPFPHGLTVKDKLSEC